MRFLYLCSLYAPWIVATAVAQPNVHIASIRMSHYAVQLVPGDPPRLAIARDGERVFEVPIVSGLTSDTQQEQLSGIEFSVRMGDDGTYELNATAQSNLWSGRRFYWHFYPDHIEFRQFATGHGKLGRV